MIQLPKTREGASHIWHQFVIRTNVRKQLIDYLDKHEIGTLIHYPIPPHLSQAYNYLGLKVFFPLQREYSEEVLSLPLYNGMTDEEQSFVIEIVNKFEV